MRKSWKVAFGVACASPIAIAVLLVGAWGAGARGAKHPDRSARSERPVVAERPQLPLSASFLGLWFPRGAHPPRTAIEQFSLSDAAPLRTLIWLTGHLAGESFAPGPGGALWLTLTTGPRPKCPNCLESAAVPDSCTNRVARLDPVTGRLTTVRKFPSSMLIEEARPSPNGRWLLLHARGCTSSWLNAHLLAINLRTGVQWTVGSEATPCHDVGAAEWSEGSSELVVPFGPSKLPAGTTHVLHTFGEEQCPSPQPSGLPS